MSHRIRRRNAVSTVAFRRLQAAAALGAALGLVLWLLPAQPASALINVGVLYGPFSEGYNCDVEVVGGIAYVADRAAYSWEPSGLRVIDVSNPTAPAAIGSLDTGTRPTGLLTYDDVAFGSDLGEPVTEALVSVDVVGGVLTGTAVSLLSPPELDALQGSSVTLGTLFLVAAGLGSGQIEVTRAQLSDAFGAPLAIDWLGSSPITVIPEPSTLLLVACGLVGLALKRRQPA